MASVSEEGTRTQPQQLVLNLIVKEAAKPREPRENGTKAAAAKPAARKMPKITAEHVANVRAHRGRRRGADVSMDHSPAFKMAMPPPGVVPKDVKIAMDEVPQVTAGWAAGNIFNIAFSQGYTFLGYPYLSELAQIPEYRLISEVISTEATRKWIKIKSKSDETAKSDDQTVKIAELNEEMDRLKVRAIFETASLQDGFFGRAHIYIDTGNTGEAKEMSTPIGEGGEFSGKKFKKGFLRGLKNVEPVWTYPMAYNAINPLADDWYKPEVWYVMQQPVHSTRLLTFVSKPVPDLMKPSFSFGGLSMTQMAKPYVDNWLQTRLSVNEIISAFSTMVLMTDLSTMLEDQGQQLNERADIFNDARNNNGLMMVDKNNEDFKNVSAPLGSLDKLQAQAQEHMSSVSRIPLIKLLGITPTGLSATSEGELACFEDTIHAYQEKLFRPHLTTVFRLAQINIWGEVDPDLFYDFEPLAEMDPKEMAEIQKLKAETHGVYVDKSVIAPEEVRQALVDDEDSLYDNIDPDDVPEVLQPEQEHVRETETVGGPSGGGGGD